VARSAGSDAELVARCRAGDAAAWNELVERFSRYVLAICTQGFRLADHDAEDVFQDVFTRVYAQLDALRSDDSFRPWLAQLTRRACIDRLRTGGRETPSDALEPTGVDDTLAVLDEALAVQDAMAELPDSCREILDRFFARDESYRTIAEALALPPGTVASRISRCLDRLKGLLEETGGDGRLEDG
jgi:RNA polymerase sigma factor (sigma-70 family)